jgi:hypothetical protein
VFDYTRPSLYVSPNGLGPSNLGDSERHQLLTAFTPLPFLFPGSVRREEL